MSRHEVTFDEPSGTMTKWVFGWDQSLMSFYLQIHDSGKDEEENPIVWLGGIPKTQMYEVEDLVREVRKRGLNIPHETRVALYGEKDDGR